MNTTIIFPVGSKVELVTAAWLHPEDEACEFTSTWLRDVSVPEAVASLRASLLDRGARGDAFTFMASTQEGTVYLVDAQGNLEAP